LEAIKEIINEHQSTVIALSIVLAIIVAVGLVAGSLIAGVTEPYVTPSTNTTSTSNTTTTTQPFTTSTLTKNLTSITIGNFTTITREQSNNTIPHPSPTPNPETMTGYPKTVKINQLIFSHNNDEYYFKGYIGHELTISYLHRGISQSEIAEPILGIGKSYTTTLNFNGYFVSLYMVDFNTLVVTKVIT
jgi:hypothetical protein